MNCVYPEWKELMTWIRIAAESRFGSLTNNAMAKYLQVPNSTYGAWSCGQSKVDMADALLIAYTFDIKWQVLCKKGYSLTKDEAWLEAMDWEAPV